MVLLTLKVICRPARLLPPVAKAEAPGSGADNRGEGFLRVPYRAMENAALRQRAEARRCFGMETLTLTEEIAGRCLKRFEKESPVETSSIHEKREEGLRKLNWLR